MADEEQPQTPLESGQGLLTEFGGLGGINNARDDYARPSTNLEKLLRLEQKILGSSNPPLNTQTQESFECSQRIYSIAAEELKGIEFNEKDLESYILAKSSSCDDENESLLIGFYSGALLRILTETNKAKGQRTRFYINGNGRRFDYLFQYAQVVDEVIVDNFAGECICLCLANHGEANRVVGMNLYGDNILQHLGGNGNIKQVIGLNITARTSVGYIAFKGTVEQVIGVNINNRNQTPLSNSVGNTLVHIATKGKANQIIGVDIYGDDILSFNGWNCCINQILAVNISGYAILVKIAEDGGQVNQIIGSYIYNFDDYHFYEATVGDGHVRQIALNDVSSRDAFLNPDKIKAATQKENAASSKDADQYGQVDEIILSDSIMSPDPTVQISPYHTPYGKLVTGKEAESRFAQISKEAHLDEITALCRAMKTAGYPKVLEIADELYALRPEFKRDFLKNKRGNKTRNRRWIKK